MSFGREAVFAVLLTTLLCVTDAQVDNNFTICQPVDGSLANYAGVSFPTFPSQFSVQIEATIARLNATYRMVEYYDGDGQRGRLEFVGGPTGNDQFILISDFVTDQAFHITPAGDGITDCTVVPLEDDKATNYTFHEIPGPNGTLQIGSANDLLVFAGHLKDQEVYLGVEYTRGVPTDHWQYCFASENITFLIDYYFAVEGWGFPFNASRVPILATVDGHNRLPSGEFEVLQNTYTFTAFDPSPLGDDVFAVPEGLVCKNRKILKPLPTSDDIKFFSSISESTNETSGHTSYFPFYYDRQANLVRYDFPFPNTSDPKSVPSRVSVIHDFTQGVQYWINRDNGLCNVTSLDATGFLTVDEVVDDQGNYVLASLTHLLSPYNDSASAYVYEGPSTVRGIAAEAWLAFIPVADSGYPNVTLENVTNLVYFSRDDWVVNGYQSMYRIVLRVHVRGTSVWNGTPVSQFDVVSDVFNVDYNEPPYEVFDAYVCFPPNQTQEVMFTLPVAPTGNTLSLLRSDIRTSLSKFTGAPGSQFGNIQIQTYSPDSIVVNLLLHDLPNAGYMNGTRKDSQTLLSEITAGISSGSLKIQLSDGTFVAPHSLQQPCPSPSFALSSTPAVSPTIAPTSNPTSSPVSNPSSTPTSNPASSPMLNPTSTPSPSPNPSSTSSQSPTATPDMNPSPCPTSDTIKLEGLTNVAGVAVGSFFGGFFTCLIVGLVVAGIVLVVRSCCKKNSYKVDYSRQLDDM